MPTAFIVGGCCQIRVRQVGVYLTCQSFYDGVQSLHPDPEADRKKDWQDNAMVGYFIGYSKTKAGYCVILGDTVFRLMKLSRRYLRAISESSIRLREGSSREATSE